MVSSLYDGSLAALLRYAYRLFALEGLGAIDVCCTLRLVGSAQLKTARVVRHGAIGERVSWPDTECDAKAFGPQ